MFYVNKIIGWVLSPLGMLFLGCLCGAMLRRCGGRIGKRGLHRLGTLLVSVSLGLFWILSCGIVTRFIGVPLEGDEVPLLDTLELGGCDAVVLLGGGMGAHEVCGRAEMFSAADRVWEAARQWKAHQNGDLKLTLSGGGVEQSTVPLLKDLGVDEVHSELLPADKVKDFFPSADALWRNSVAVKEWVARFCYWLKGCRSR